MLRDTDQGSTECLSFFLLLAFDSFLQPHREGLHEIRDGKMLLPGERGHDAQLKMRSVQTARAAKIILARALTWPDPGSQIRWGGCATLPRVGSFSRPGLLSPPLPGEAGGAASSSLFPSGARLARRGGGGAAPPRCPERRARPLI